MNLLNKIPIKFLTVENIVRNRTIAMCKFSVYRDNIFIHNINVDRQFRNKNIGSSLLKDVEIYAIKRRLNKISLIVHQKPNDSLLDFYKKNGYRLTNNKISQYDDGENIYDVIKMEKNLI